jgi:hypothetical protein
MKLGTTTSSHSPTQLYLLKAISPTHILEWILIGRNLQMLGTITPMFFTKPEPDKNN